jgi:type I restriction enzyme S subunit
MRMASPPKAKIATVAKVISGFAFKSEEFQENGIPVIKIKNIRLGSVDRSAIQCVPEKYLSLDPKYHVRPGDILISLTGSHINQPNSVVGRVARFPKSFKVALLNQRAGKFIITAPDKCDPSYLYHHLVDEQTRRDIASFAHGAANQANVSPNQVASLKINLPSLPTQRKIAAILSAYDDLIENNLRRIKILEEMAQNLYREWFVKFCFPGHEKVQMVDSPMGKIPEGWEVIKIGGLLEKVRRKKKLKKQYYEIDGPIPVVDQGRDFIGGYTTDPETLIDSPLPIIVFGDHTRVLKYVDFPFACGADGTQLLRPNTEQMPMSLFYYVLKSIDLSNFAYARHFKFLKEQEILVPNEQIARLFAQVADPMRDLIRCLLSRNTNLRRTRDLLLPKLISGELDVSDLDIKTGGPIQ